MEKMDLLGWTGERLSVLCCQYQPHWLKGSRESLYNSISNERAHLFSMTHDLYHLPIAAVFKMPVVITSYSEMWDLWGDLAAHRSTILDKLVLLIMRLFACVAQSEAVYLSVHPHLHTHPLILSPDRLMPDQQCLQTGGTPESINTAGPGISLHKSPLLHLFAKMWMRHLTALHLTATKLHLPL